MLFLIIFMAVIVFILGYILGYINEPITVKKEKRESVSFYDTKDREFENFLNYDGTEQS